MAPLVAGAAKRSASSRCKSAGVSQRCGGRHSLGTGSQADQLAQLEQPIVSGVLLSRTVGPQGLHNGPAKAWPAPHSSSATHTARRSIDCTKSTTPSKPAWPSGKPNRSCSRAVQPPLCFSPSKPATQPPRQINNDAATSRKLTTRVAWPPTTEPPRSWRLSFASADYTRISLITLPPSTPVSLASSP